MSLVTLEAAIAHLRQISGVDDDEIQRKLDEAEAWALDVMGPNADSDWDDETVPAMIRSAILCRLQALYDGSADHFTLADNLIRRWRGNVIA
jgi:hypothetical protein